MLPIKNLRLPGGDFENGHFGSKEKLELLVGIVDNATFFGLFALLCFVLFGLVGWLFVCLFVCIVCFFLRLVVRPLMLGQLMADILHQFVGSLSQYSQGFIHPKLCRIPSVNRMPTHS